MKKFFAVIVSTVAVSSAALAEGMMLVLPANVNLLNLGFDLMRMKPAGAIEMACYGGTDEVKTLEVFDRRAFRWISVPQSTWNDGSIPGASKDALIIVGDSQAAADLLEAAQWADNIITPSGHNAHEVVNAVHSFSPLTEKQWKSLSSGYGITLREIATESRYDRYSRAETEGATAPAPAPVPAEIELAPSEIIIVTHVNGEEQGDTAEEPEVKEAEEAVAEEAAPAEVKEAEAVAEEAKPAEAPVEAAAEELEPVQEPEQGGAAAPAEVKEAEAAVEKAEAPAEAAPVEVKEAEAAVEEAPVEPVQEPVAGQSNEDKAETILEAFRKNAPAVETPEVGVAAVSAPVAEAPAVETPVAKVPAIETPVVEATAVEVPAVKVPTEEEVAAAKKTVAEALAKAKAEVEGVKEEVETALDIPAPPVEVAAPAEVPEIVAPPTTVKIPELPVVPAINVNTESK